MRYYNCMIATTIALGFSALVPASASSLVYHPVNPTFGGNPLNGTPLLSQAQAQGEGVKSGPQGPDLSGLTNALSNLPNSSGTPSNGSGATQMMVIPRNP
jgi:curli production assembly/transport component CsgF